MPEYFRYVIDLVRRQFVLARTIDFSDVEFSNVRWALGAAILLVLGVLTKLLYRWVRRKKRFARQSSGHWAIRRHPRPYWQKLAYITPKIPLALATAFLLIAIARPYVTNYHNTSTAKSTEICYLEDASGSMLLRFGGVNKSRAEAARSALLDFLKLRKGKHDRACFWLFSSNPYKIENFTLDERSFMFQVYNAPWVFGYNSDPALTPHGKIIEKSGEGGTNMDLALQATAKYFDREGVEEDLGMGKTRAPRRVLVIITDAEVDTYPEKGFNDLADKRIIPYLIHLRGTSTPQSGSGSAPSPSSVPVPPVPLSPNAQQFVDAIEKYGGKSFVIMDGAETERVLRDAFREIDRIEKVESLKGQYAERAEIFQLPLAASILCLLCSLFAGFIIEIKFGSYP